MSNWINELVATRPIGRKYVAWAGEVEFLGASESDSAGRRVKLRIVRPPEQVALVNPFAKFTRRRRGHTGSRFEVGVAEIDGSREFMLETGLINWNDDPRGSTVTLVLDAAASHPFMHDRRPSKDMSGTRYMMTFIEKADDDTLIREDKIARLEQAKTTGRHQTLSNVARLLTKNQRFRDWLREVEDDSSDWTMKDADDWLKDACGIQSKADLDADDTPEGAQAVVKFHKIRTRFVDWQHEMGFRDE